MNRIRVALALMACVLVTLGAPAAAQSPVDQASWASLKKEVRLPNGMRLAYVEAGDPEGEPCSCCTASRTAAEASRRWSRTSADTAC